jgi:hypothetical protein
MMVINLDSITAYQGAVGQAALRREQEKQLESKHRAKRAMGRKMRRNTALEKEEMVLSL